MIEAVFIKVRQLAERRSTEEPAAVRGAGRSAGGGAKIVIEPKERLPID
jgi:hypothetical protein